jgi:undecaprenyl-diphosphatase
MIVADAELFRRINGFAGHYPALDTLGIFLATYLIWIVAVIAIAPPIAFGLRHRRFPMNKRDAAEEAKRAAVSLHAAVAAALALAGNFLFSLFVIFRPRPFVALRGVTQLIDIPTGYKSFPSDHASIAFAIAFSVLFFRPRTGAALLACAFLVGFGRVYVGVHYPADIVTGIFVGLFWALAVRFVGTRTHEIEKLKRFFRKKSL